MSQRQFIIDTTVTVRQIVDLEDADVCRYTYGEATHISDLGPDDLEPEHWTNAAAGHAREKINTFAENNNATVLSYGEQTIEEKTA